MVSKSSALFKISAKTFCEMKVWICIPVFNRVEFTLKCLESLKKQTYHNYMIVICDHGSTDGTSERIHSAYPEVIVLQESQDLWWTGAINRCVEYVLNAGDSDLDAVVTLNNDLEVDSDYISTLVGAVKRYPKAIITSAGYDIRTRLLVSSGLRQNWLTSKVGITDPDKDRMPGEDDLVEVTHAPGRGTLIPLSAFKELGLYDEVHLPHYAADYDFTFRASRQGGYRIIISYRAKVFSHVEATGMTTIRQEFNWSALKRYLTDMKSPANLSARWWLAVNNCPRFLLPSYLVLDFFFVVGSFFKYHLIRKVSLLTN